MVWPGTCPGSYHMLLNIEILCCKFPGEYHLILTSTSRQVFALTFFSFCEKEDSFKAYILLVY